MLWSELVGALKAGNFCALRLALDAPNKVRTYISDCLRRYDELAEVGLPHRFPVRYVCEQGWGTTDPDERIVLPSRLGGGGGTHLQELASLAVVTGVLKPKKVFEIGTFTGLTTCIFVFNAPPGATIITLDLPPDSPLENVRDSNYLPSDVQLVQEREAGRFIREFGLQDRCQQIYCDSLQFDHSPHRRSVELGFIDGAHDLLHVRNDTRKMAEMMADRGLVFWHDYGGKGGFRPLANYLEILAKRIPVFRIIGSSLAWASGADLRSLFETPGSEIL